MLKDIWWVHYAPDMMTEYYQCYDEGLDVESYRAICERISSAPEGRDEFAWNVALQMHGEKLRDGYPYREPSGYEAILQARPERRHTFDRPDPDLLPDRIKGAWTGRIAGCLLGKPVEGMRRDTLYPLLRLTGNYPMRDYIRASRFTDEVIKQVPLDSGGCWADNVHGIEPIDDDTNYTVFSLKLVTRFGRGFTPDDVMLGWLDDIPYQALCTAERVAYRNAANGLLPPETAIYHNPYREWIGAQIRGDFFGYINPGNPEEAASMAWRDASISHVKNGIYGEMYCTAMTAAAAVTDDLMTIIEAGLDEIPAHCRLRADVEKVIAWYREGLDLETVIERIHETYDEHTSYGWCHTDPNAMIVTAALLFGQGDFGKSVCAAVQAAFDTDCNGATVGSIIGMRNGYAALPKEWEEPFAGKLMTSIMGYNTVDTDFLTEQTVALLGSENPN